MPGISSLWCSNMSDEVTLLPSQPADQGIVKPVIEIFDRVTATVSQPFLQLFNLSDFHATEKLLTEVAGATQVEFGSAPGTTPGRPVFSVFGSLANVMKTESLLYEKFKDITGVSVEAAPDVNVQGKQDVQVLEGAETTASQTSGLPYVATGGLTMDSTHAGYKQESARKSRYKLSDENRKYKQLCLLLGFGEPDPKTTTSSGKAKQTAEGKEAKGIEDGSASRQTKEETSPSKQAVSEGVIAVSNKRVKPTSPHSAKTDSHQKSRISVPLESVANPPEKESRVEDFSTPRVRKRTLRSRKEMGVEEADTASPKPLRKQNQRLKDSPPQRKSPRTRKQQRADEEEEVDSSRQKRSHRIATRSQQENGLKSTSDPSLKEKVPLRQQRKQRCKRKGAEENEPSPRKRGRGGCQMEAMQESGSEEPLCPSTSPAKLLSSSKGSTSMEDIQGKSSVQDVQGGSLVEDIQGKSSVEDIQVGSSVKDIQGGSSVEDIQEGSSVKDIQGGSSVEDIQGGSSVEDIQGGSSVEDIQGGSAVKDIQEGSSVKDIQGGSSVEDIQAGSSVEDIQEGSSVKDIQGGSSVEDIQGGSSVKDIQAGSSVEDIQGRSSVEDIQGGSSVEDIQGGSSVKDIQEGSSVKDIQGGSLVEDIQGKSSVEDIQVGSSVEDIQGGSSVEDIQGGSSVEDIQGGSSVKDIQGGSSVEDIRGKKSSLEDIQGGSSVESAVATALSTNVITQEKSQQSDMSDIDATLQAIAKESHIQVNIPAEILSNQKTPEISQLKEGLKPAAPLDNASPLKQHNSKGKAVMPDEIPSEVLCKKMQDSSENRFTYSSCILREIDMYREEQQDEVFRLIQDEDRVFISMEVRPCPICCQEFESFQSLSAHVMYSHFKFKCQKCLGLFSKEELLVAHLRDDSICQGPRLKSRRKRRAPKKYLKRKDLRCGDCDQVFGHRSRLDKHQLQAHKADIRCYACDATFPKLNRLRVHIDLMHTIQEAHVCDICGKGFSVLANMLGHRRRHGAPLRHCCDTCGKGFKSKSSLVDHINTHRPTGEKQYKFLCGICGKRFNHKKVLVDHQNSHTGARPYQCELCNRTFGSSSSLKAHLKTKHSDNRPYQCEHCPRAFKDKRALQCHIVTHTGISEHVCPYCDRPFGAASVLNSHTRKCKKSKEKKDASTPDYVTVVEAGPSLGPIDPAADSTTDFLSVVHEEDISAVDTVELAFEDEQIAELQVTAEMLPESFMYMCSACNETFEDMMSAESHINTCEKAESVADTWS